ncbi:DUF917 family protein [Sulfurimonas sp.]|uniref:S-methyl thiohydantoin desulfurase domain-containing protein n=1 Tax=Sulfurimonas sp. TaxID=2022749 RepID=UPI00356AF9EE
MTITTKEEFYTLLKGATFLASGGGGPFGLAKTIVDEYFKNVDTFVIDIVDLETVNPDQWTAIAAGMAQPSAGILLTPQTIVEPTVNAVKAMEKLLSVGMTKKNDTRFDGFQRFDFLTPIEVGAINVTIPLISAYLLGNNLSIVDGDPSGRSVPTIDLTTFAVSQPVMPNMATSAGEDYEYSVLSLKNYKDLGIAYAKLIQAGLIGIDTGLCLAPMTAQTLSQNNIVTGTLRDAYNIGLIFEQNISAAQRLESIQAYLLSEAQTPRELKTICTGVAKEYYTKTEEDNDLGYLTIETDDGRGIYTILIQNENMLGQFNDEISINITSPDSICYVSTQDGILDDSDIYDNTLISQKLQNGEEVHISVVAIEAASVIKENKQLMSAWNEAYKTSRYYGTYNESIWTE